jgi:hypothetical protein
MSGTAMRSGEDSWDDVYGQLVEVLSGVGKNDSCGDGDYWIVDDDWRGKHQKICVANGQFWTPEVQERVCRLLKDNFADWGVYIVFEDGSGRPGFILYENGVTQQPRW